MPPAPFPILLHQLYQRSNHTQTRCRLIEIYREFLSSCSNARSNLDLIRCTPFDGQFGRNVCRSRRFFPCRHLFVVCSPRTKFASEIGIVMLHKSERNPHRRISCRLSLLLVRSSPLLLSPTCQNTVITLQFVDFHSFRVIVIMRFKLVLLCLFCIAANCVGKCLHRLQLITCLQLAASCAKATSACGSYDDTFRFSLLVEQDATWPCTSRSARCNQRLLRSIRTASIS